tara:strand:- start:4100 stop:4222 length:123 start_codon:yes stop_codon:yes gene_type:complete
MEQDQTGLLLIVSFEILNGRMLYFLLIPTIRLLATDVGFG